MPDANKFAKLRAVGYQIPVTCGLCAHGDFSGRATWGTCRLHRYEHLRQGNPEGGRGVSIHIAGTCSSAEANPAATLILGAHSEFLKK